MDTHILIIDDEESLRNSLGGILAHHGYIVSEAVDASAALSFLHRAKSKGSFPHLIFLDVRLPDRNGLELLEDIKALHANCPVLIITGYGSVPQSVEAMDKGAADYILKPINADELIVRTKKALKGLQLQEQMSYFSEELYANKTNEYVLGPNLAMRRIHESLQAISQSPATTVLVYGETGTGKELIARQLHQMSKRKSFPFVAINATALPTNLLESELFGHEEGAFTGAVNSKKGLFEVASNGSLFLDEIGDMDLAMQAKLLRALQERTIRKVGGTNELPIDVRLIAATNKDLGEAVKNGLFREDLYYRLNVVPIALPALRERKEDIEALVTHFVHSFNNEFGRQVQEISPKALKALKLYPWPGNIRELRNLIERALLLECTGHVLEYHHLRFDHPQKNELSFPSPLRKMQIQIGENITLEQVEKEHIQAVLAAHNGNKNQASQILGIDRSTLYNKLKKYESV